jgi:hypothetical protein
MWTWSSGKQSQQAVETWECGACGIVRQGVVTGAVAWMGCGSGPRPVREVTAWAADGPAGTVDHW